MVIQGNSKSYEGIQQNSSSDDSNGSSQFQQPGKQSVCRVYSTPNMHKRPTINRQMGLSTLAALHRRFGLPAPVSTHTRLSADFRASANNALDILRQTIQAAVTKEIDDVIKKYFQKFFVPAVNNIRTNLGEESVSEEQVRAVCRSMLDATRTLYAVAPRIAAVASPRPEASDSESSNSADLTFGRVTDTSKRNQIKRKESDKDSDACSAWKNKKVKVEVISDEAGTFRNSLRNKWDPQRLKHDTLFIMGSHAQKMLGGRGLVYRAHAAELPCYLPDLADRAWINTHNLATHTHTHTQHIMVLEDIKELAASEHYRKSALPLEELAGFRAPPFMLCKMRAFLMKGNSTDNITSPLTPKTEHFTLITEIKSEIVESPNSNLTQYEGVKSEENLWETEWMGQVKYEMQSPNSNKKLHNNFVKTQFSELKDNYESKQMKVEVEEQDKQRRDNFDFLDYWLPSMASEAGASSAIRHVTGANADSIRLANEEFHLGFSVSEVPRAPFSRPATPNSKCITVESSAGGPVHSVPVARLHGHIAHAGHDHGHDREHGRDRAVPPHQPPYHPQIHLSSVPYESKAGVSSEAIMSSSVGSDVSRAPPKQFSPGNVLHNNTVSRNMLHRSLNLLGGARQTFYPASSSASFSVTLETGTVPRIASTSTNAKSYDAGSTTEGIIQTAHKSSTTLRKVLNDAHAIGNATSVQDSSARASTHVERNTGTRRAWRVRPSDSDSDGVGSSSDAAASAQSGAGAESRGSMLSAAHATLSALLAGSKLAPHLPN